ncbi:hypothetical protein QYB59_002224 [Clostridium perfringens]|nr:hypothetical protein [Clostridium perfringens]MDZ4992035.1 hypothetical protein [Clostridium perfringens]
MIVDINNVIYVAAFEKWSLIVTLDGKETAFRCLLQKYMKSLEYKELLDAINHS